jgi:hypothetical protein
MTSDLAINLEQKSERRKSDMFKVNSFFNVLTQDMTVSKTIENVTLGPTIRSTQYRYAEVCILLISSVSL